MVEAIVKFCYVTVIALAIVGFCNVVMILVDRVVTGKWPFETKDGD